MTTTPVHPSTGVFNASIHQINQQLGTDIKGFTHGDTSLDTLLAHLYPIRGRGTMRVYPYDDVDLDMDDVNRRALNDLRKSVAAIIYLPEVMTKGGMWVRVSALSKKGGDYEVVLVDARGTEVLRILWDDLCAAGDYEMVLVWDVAADSTTPPAPLVLLLVCAILTAIITVTLSAN